MTLLPSLLLSSHCLTDDVSNRQIRVRIRRNRPRRGNRRRLRGEDDEVQLPLLRNRLLLFPEEERRLADDDHHENCSGSGSGARILWLFQRNEVRFY